MLIWSLKDAQRRALWLAYFVYRVLFPAAGGDSDVNPSSQQWNGILPVASR